MQFTCAQNVYQHCSEEPGNVCEMLWYCISLRVQNHNVSK